MDVMLNKGEGKSFWVLGDLYTFKVTGEETNGTLTVIDQRIQPQNGPPPHIHHREDEVFYVIDGTFSFLSGEEVKVLEAGSFAYIPKGTLHTFKNIGDQPGKLLVSVTPAGLENFFYSVGTPAEGLTDPPPFDPGVIEKLLQLATDYEMELKIPDPME